ncbi:TonB-dependent receptor domain-containing protein [Ferrimonas balearica]|uniref:TonB-dependent receptor domain-containing protein n=1 Tax=Ferrimonas balearica TaxID=44012 RepID=UPI001C58C646|nr:TonB-dependent receptor [Ferrimonas balearica]MBW3138287.1 TonB-dependent receptor [Ferrimonas balearica]MBW3164165.1 TonB-dependent receptor [Ferrimonas balearica]MBY6105348.1 TonB-dependent receptor [Ferrimonas balearica]MBY6224140.1 TonB-dependent receptor [Ferrimonas balearica]
MHNNSVVNKAVRFALVAGATTAAWTAPVAFAAEGADVERIEVTGSRIKRTDLEGANPVTVVDQADIERMSVTNVGDLLQNLSSSAGAAVNTQTNNGGDSSVRFSLRGLGSERTLVLINGRRVVAGGGGANGSVDLNTIPVSIIKRVEVLKDGASAVYGSDAIAGVVNIITKNDFEGFEVKAEYGETSEGDGEQKSIDVLFGAASDKGNVVLAMGYSDQKSIFMGDRAFSEYELRAFPDGSTEQGGSSAPPWGNMDGFDGDNVTQGPEFGDWRPYNGSTDSYNYNPVNYLQTPSSKRYVNVFANYEIAETSWLGVVNAFGEASYTETNGNRLLAPEPLAPLIFFGSPAPYSPNNYYNQMYGPKGPNGESFEIADWRRRMVETGGRADMRDYKTLRTVVGLNGELANDWSWELSYTFGKNDSVNRGEGYFNLDRVAEAVGPTGWLDENGQLIVDGAGNPVAAPGNGSELVCLGDGNVIIDGCVPLNIFGQPGTDTQITPEMLQYISGDYNTTELGQNRQEVIQAIISGDLFEMPAGLVSFAAGYEYRKESGSYTPDALILQGTTTAGSAVGTEGSYSVDEFYGEFYVPLLSDIPLIERLDVTLAVRYSDYSTFGDNTSFAGGIEYRPIEDLLLRADYSEAFRAPNTSELYGGASTSFPEATDPCEEGPVNANCIATGVPEGGYGPSGVEQIPTKIGGADNWDDYQLQPETADIFTVGMVYNPSWLDGFAMTVDYWNIQLTDAISSVGTQARLDGCYERGEYCDSIFRFGEDSAVPGNIIIVNDFTVNVGGVDTSGIDFDFRYAFELGGAGDFVVGLDGTYLLNYEKEIAGGEVIDHTGRFEEGHDGMFAEWKSNLTLLWSIADFDTALMGHYISGVTEVESGWWTEAFEREVPSNTTWDLQTSYTATENLKFTLGVNNLFDKQPPFVFSAFGANTDVATYDVIGRFMYARVNLAF